MFEEQLPFRRPCSGFLEKDPSLPPLNGNTVRSPPLISVDGVFGGAESASPYPYVGIMFLILSFLEIPVICRAAFIMDNSCTSSAFTEGHSAGNGLNVPAIMAARTLKPE